MWWSSGFKTHDSSAQGHPGLIPGPGTSIPYTPCCEAKNNFFITKHPFLATVWENEPFNSHSGSTNHCHLILQRLKLLSRNMLRNVHLLWVMNSARVDYEIIKQMLREITHINAKNVYHSIVHSDWKSQENKDLVFNYGDEKYKPMKIKCLKGE